MQLSGRATEALWGFAAQLQASHFVLRRPGLVPELWTALCG